MVILTNKLRPNSKKILGTQSLGIQRMHIISWDTCRFHLEKSLSDSLSRPLTDQEQESIVKKVLDLVESSLNEYDSFVSSELGKPLEERSILDFPFLHDKLGYQVKEVQNNDD